VLGNAYAGALPGSEEGPCASGLLLELVPAVGIRVIDSVGADRLPLAYRTVVPGSHRTMLLTLLPTTALERRGLIWTAQRFDTRPGDGSGRLWTRPILLLRIRRSRRSGPGSAVRAISGPLAPVNRGQQRSLAVMSKPRSAPMTARNQTIPKLIAQQSTARSGELVIGGQHHGPHQPLTPGLT
jgi:hypothetical protein